MLSGWRRRRPGRKPLQLSTPTLVARTSSWFLTGCALLFIAGNSACLQPTSIADLDIATHGFKFQERELIAATSSPQTVLVGHFLGGCVADIAMLCREGTKGPVVRFYRANSDSWELISESVLQSKLHSVDVARIDGVDRVLVCEGDGIDWLDPLSGELRQLVAWDIELATLPESAIPQVNISEDLNGDDRDDLVIPGAEGFTVLIQGEGGGFSAPLQIGPSFDMTRFVEGQGGRYDPWPRSRIHLIDENGDGRSDLVYWDCDHFNVHRQDEHGEFAVAPATFAIPVSFDSDDLSYLAAPLGIRQRKLDQRPHGTMNGKVLESLRDVNGDRIPDLVIFTLRVKGIWSAGFRYDVHYGTRNAGGKLGFRANADAVIRSNGLPFGLTALRRGPTDEGGMLFSTLPIGVMSTPAMIARAGLTRSLRLRLEFHCLEDGRYPEPPREIRGIQAEVPGVSGERGMHRPAILVEDVNGDGLDELLMQYRRDELHVYLGVARPRLFADRPTRLAVTMPRAEFTRAVDFNADGKRDILMHHRSSTEPDRVTVLIPE